METHAKAAKAAKVAKEAMDEKIKGQILRLAGEYSILSKRYSLCAGCDVESLAARAAPDPFAVREAYCRILV